MISDRRLIDAVVEVSHALHQRGWVANHDGNVTARARSRAGKGRYLATPTATSKAKVDGSNLLVVDDAGNRVSGTSRRFSEVNLHLAVYQRRDDVNAVVHAHPPYATALACSGSDLLERPFIPEAVVSIGPSIPTVPFAVPGDDAARALAAYIDGFDAVLLGNHGVLTWGADVELAYLRMELVEHLARIATKAQATGGVRALPDAALPKLLEARANAGLGEAATRAALARPATTKTETNMSAIIREEIERALRD